MGLQPIYSHNPNYNLNPIFPKLKLGWTWKMTLHQYPPPLLKIMVIVLLWLVIYSLINIDLPQHNKKTIKDNIKDNIKDIIKGNIKDDLKGDFRVRGCSSIM